MIRPWSTYLPKMYQYHHSLCIYTTKQICYFGKVIGYLQLRDYAYYYERQ